MKKKFVFFLLIGITVVLGRPQSDNSGKMNQHHRPNPHYSTSPSHDTPRVGADPCTWGPSYWHKNEETMKECGITEDRPIRKVNKKDKEFSQGLKNVKRRRNPGALNPQE